MDINTQKSQNIHPNSMATTRMRISKLWAHQKFRTFSRRPMVIVKVPVIIVVGNHPSDMHSEPFIFSSSSARALVTSSKHTRRTTSTRIGQNNPYLAIYQRPCLLRCEDISRWWPSTIKIENDSLDMIKKCFLALYHHHWSAGQNDLAPILSKTIIIHSFWKASNVIFRSVSTHVVAFFLFLNYLIWFLKIAKL